MGEFIGDGPGVQGRPIDGGSGADPGRRWPDALYLHIPFCFHKCHYCDFFSLVEPAGPQDRQAAFTEALIREFEQRFPPHPIPPTATRSGAGVGPGAQKTKSSERPGTTSGNGGEDRALDTVFVGGGTPTLLRVEHWQRLLEVMHGGDRRGEGGQGGGVLGSHTEFTVEANPETVTAELMTVLAAGGVNRLSVGAQSFNLDHLKTLERWHDPASVARSVGLARGAGVARLNLDLIFAIPGQSLADWDADLSAALDLGPDHLSCYNLTYEPNTAMTTRLRQGRITPCDTSVERAMYEHTMARLADAGFEHYEVSAWARPGQRCRHNLHYWRNHDWLGLGPGAASHLAGRRWKNKPHLDQYIAGSPHPPVIEVEHPDARGRAAETLMLGLRLRDGVDAAWFDTQFADRTAETAQFLDAGLIERNSQTLRLTHAGLLVADDVIARLM